ncbi:MAG: 6-hydroxymethylpterin diphosphokinase MptE-like protein [Candidatus Helarchaeota archaeon]
MGIKHLLSANVKRNIKYSAQYLTRINYWLASKGIFLNDNQKNVLKLKDKHNGERAFIIGSGPSINKMDLSHIKGEITFGHNAFFLIREKVGFMPTYYLIEDPLPAEDNADQINKLRGTTKIFAHDLSCCLKKDNDTIYVFFERNYMDYRSNNFPKFSRDALRCVFWGGTVAYMSLQLAFYMGIKDVYLIGIDLNYNIPEEAKKDQIITSDGPDVNHFHPDYFGKGKRWHDPKVNRMQRSFEKAAKVFKQNNRRVFNATLGGNLKNINQVSYDNIFRNLPV